MLILQFETVEQKNDRFSYAICDKTDLNFPALRDFVIVSSHSQALQWIGRVEGIISSEQDVKILQIKLLHGYTTKWINQIPICRMRGRPDFGSSVCLLQDSSLVKFLNAAGHYDFGS